MTGRDSGRIRTEGIWDLPHRRGMEGGVFHLRGGSALGRAFLTLSFLEVWVNSRLRDHLHTGRL